MIPFVVLGAAGIFIWAMIKAGGWGAANPSIVAICICALAYVALHFWHRRRIAEIQDREIALSAQYKRVNRFLPWPRECLFCGMHLHDFWAVKHHDNSRTSPCADLITQRELADAGPPETDAGPPEVDGGPPAAPTFTATVIGRAAGAVDTFTDDPSQLEGGTDAVE